MPMTNKTPTYINADRFISWIDAGHYRSPTEPVFSEQEIVHIIKQQPVCLVEPIVYAKWVVNKGMDAPEYHDKHKCSNCKQQVAPSLYGEKEDRYGTEVYRQSRPRRRVFR